MRSKISILGVFISVLFVACNNDYELLYEAQKPERKQVKQVVDSGEFKNDYAIIIDMSLPSDKKRLFLVNLLEDKLIYNTWVAHGKGSGTGSVAEKFSNTPDSYCSSLGRYKVKEEYDGKHGLSYRLIGLDESNSNALDRDIVMHAADYVGWKYAFWDSRIGNSWGCPAVSPDALDFLKHYIDKDMLIWIYN